MPKQLLTPLDVGPDRITNVAGLDTASVRWHLYCNDGMTDSCICPNKMSPIDRRRMLRVDARRAFQRLTPGTLLMIEEPLSLKSGKTNILLSMAAGAIEAATDGLDIFVGYANVSAWKQVVIGHGGADKAMIKTWVQENMDLRFDGPGEEDFYDAAAISVYGEICLGLR